MAWYGGQDPVAAALWILEATGVIVTLSVAAWLLLTRAPSNAGEPVLSVAALLLVGGAAGALSVSALFGGLAAGVFWRFVGGAARDNITRGVLFIQHPLLVLVLIVAGARVEVTTAALILGGVYTAARILGKLASRIAFRRFVDDRLPTRAEREWLSPGIFGVAFALNALSTFGPQASLLLATVVVGTIGSELVALTAAVRSRQP
jgi:hypothetical protein